MRIDKFLCDALNISRSVAKNKISSKAVAVNGQVVRSSSVHVDENRDEVTVDGQKVSYKKYVYIMMNKPEGVISATNDASAKTAIDLLTESDKRHDLFVAGRLDKNTTGFLLLTNDGDFAHSILSPKKHVFKTYYVTLERNVENNYEEKFFEGVELEDGYLCKSADYYAVNDKECLLRIREGKFHQIKRMFKSLGNEVVALKRIGMGELFLDKSLGYGDYRHLNENEVEKILNKITKTDLKTIEKGLK